MTKVSSVVSSTIGSYLTNVKTWGGVMYNVLEEGLVGGGVVDDTAALQTLIDKAIAAGRRTIYFPHGDNGQYYVISLTNADQVDFVGDNCVFVGGYTGVIANFGGIAALQAQTVTGVFNAVTGYGAKGDSGVTNNYTPIQNAIDDAEAAGGGIVYIPNAGRYHYMPELEIPDKVYLIGAGEDLVTLVYAGGEAIGIKSKSGSDIRTQLLGGFKLEGSFLTGGGTDQFNANKIVSRYSDKKYAFVSGVIRYVTGTGWYVQSDTDHKPIGISGVSVVGNAVRISFDFTAKNVGSLVITPDDILAAKGYTVAGSAVGLSAADFRFARIVDIYGRASYNTGTSSWSFNGTTNTDQYNLTLTDQGSGVIRISHASDDIGFLPVMLTGFLESYYPQVYNFDTTYFDVAFYDRSTGSRVTAYDANCRFMFRRGGYTMPSASNGYPYVDGNFWVMGLMEV